MKKISIVSSRNFTVLWKTSNKVIVSYPVPASIPFLIWHQLSLSSFSLALLFVVKRRWFSNFYRTFFIESFIFRRPLSYCYPSAWFFLSKPLHCKFISLQKIRFTLFFPCLSIFSLLPPATALFDCCARKI